MVFNTGADAEQTRLPRPPARARWPANGVAARLTGPGTVATRLRRTHWSDHADHQSDHAGGPPEGAPPVPTHTVVIPADVQMVTLLGPRDELLRTMERAFPQVQIHVRGNEFHLSGPSAEVALAERIIDELLDVIDGGQPLNRDAVERSISMLRAQTARAPRRRADDEHRQQPRPHDPAEDAEPEALRRRHRRAHHRLRHRPGRHRQDLPRDGQGRRGAAGQAGQPDHPHPPGRRGGGAARLPARARSTTRSTPTCARSTTRCTTWSTPSRSRGSWRPAPSRSPRWPTCGAGPSRSIQRS